MSSSVLKRTTPGHSPDTRRWVLEWRFPFVGARVRYDKRQITAARIYVDVGTLLQTITNVPVHDRSKAADALQLDGRNLSLIVNAIPTAAWTTRPDPGATFHFTLPADREAST
jgi:hypothetical protein